MPCPPHSAAFALALLLLTTGDALRAEEPVSRGAALKQIAYMYGVIEYCGLNNDQVFDGYLRETRFLRRRDGITDPVARWLRIRGLTAADLEYGDRGLGGFRNWCRTEGLDAARHFLDFRAQSLAGEGP